MSSEVQVLRRAEYQIPLTYKDALITSKAFSDIWYKMKLRCDSGRPCFSKNPQKWEKKLTSAFTSAIEGLEDLDDRKETAYYETYNYGKCIVCGKPIKKYRRNDHIIPVAIFQKHNLQPIRYRKINYLPMCPHHNKIKGTKLFLEWWYEDLHKHLWDFPIVSAFIQVLRAYYYLYKDIGKLEEPAPSLWHRVLKEEKMILENWHPLLPAFFEGKAAEYGISLGW